MSACSQEETFGLIPCRQERHSNRLAIPLSESCLNRTDARDALGTKKRPGAKAPRRVETKPLLHFLLRCRIHESENFCLAHRIRFGGPRTSVRSAIAIPLVMGVEEHVRVVCARGPVLAKATACQAFVIAYVGNVFEVSDDTRSR